MTDQRLERLSKADARAFAMRLLAREHLDASYRLAYSILQDAADAQDATHDAFETAWRRWSTLRDPDRFVAWFDRILVNTCKHRLRDRGRHRTRDISSELSISVPGPGANVARRDLVLAVVNTLGPDHRVVLALRYYRDMTVDEIARVLGIRPGTVKSRLHYALRKLQVVLGEIEASEGSR